MSFFQFFVEVYLITVEKPTVYRVRVVSRASISLYTVTLTPRRPCPTAELTLVSIRQVVLLAIRN